MATVYLASRKERPGEWLALKRIHPHLIERDDVRLMFDNEALILSRLEHPGICGIVDWGIVGDAPYLTMQYLHGAPLSGVLKRLLEQHVPLPINLMVYVIAAIADALHYAHEATNADGQPLDLVHRDISPQNIFVTFSGEVKLLDFGVAKAASLESLTRTGHIKGKYAYMSPEQARGDPLDRRSDIFSLGIVLWESLTGRHLFKRKREIDTLDAIMQNVVPNPSRLNPDVPDELDRVLNRILQARAARRYQNGHDVSEVLWSYLTTVDRPMGADEVADILQATFPDHPPPKEQANLLETKPDALRLQDHTSRLPLPSIDAEILDEITMGPRSGPPKAALRPTMEFPKSEVEQKQRDVAGTAKLPVVSADEVALSDTDEQNLPNGDDIETFARGSDEDTSDPVTIPPNAATTRAVPVTPLAPRDPSEGLDAPTEFVPRRDSSTGGQSLPDQARDHPTDPPLGRLETSDDPYDERTLGPQEVTPYRPEDWIEGTEVPGQTGPADRPDSAEEAWGEGTELSPELMREATGGSWEQLGAPAADSPNTTREEPVDVLVKASVSDNDGVSVLADPTGEPLIDWRDDVANVAPTVADPRLRQEVADALEQLEQETLGPNAFSDRPVVAPHPYDAGEVGFGGLASEHRPTEVADGGTDDAGALGDAIPVQMGGSDVPPSGPGIQAAAEIKLATQPPLEDPAEALPAANKTASRGLLPLAIVASLVVLASAAYYLLDFFSA